MRIALGISYDGSQYHGWQNQTGLNTVQQQVQAALSKIANHPIEVVSAGRTDSQVHAYGQVIHFDTDAVRDSRAWLFGVNSNLPRDITINWVKEVSDNFHARFSAQSRRYHYYIYNHHLRPALMGRQVAWHYPSLDERRMQRAAHYLLGEQDFSSFRAVGCQSRHAVRSIFDCRVKRFGKMVVIDICANAFLYHMVRNIAGVLMAIGSGKQDIDWMQNVINARDRTLGGVTAPASGLYLVEVKYPESLRIPTPRIPFPLLYL